VNVSAAKLSGRKPRWPKTPCLDLSLWSLTGLSDPGLTALFKQLIFMLLLDLKHHDTDTYLGLVDQIGKAV
jgi:hypothetical protein